MLSLKVCVLFACCGFLCNTTAILRARKDPISLIWQLTNYAVNSGHGRQSYYRPNYLHTNAYKVNNFLPNMQTILGILHLIARNDDHHCVPKMLCEFTSWGGTIPSIGIPSFQVDIDSLSTLLSMFDGPTTSPIILFGKAALLGYSSGGNDTETCTIAHPKCPKDPDVLLNYLNNHNGGFFRYFNLIRPDDTSSQNYNSYNQVNLQNQISFNPHKYFRGRDEERIIDKDEGFKYFRFPYQRENDVSEDNEKVIFPF